jgi:endoglucanase
MSARGAVLAAALAATLFAAAAGATLRLARLHEGPDPGQEREAVRSARAFLDRYVAADGRVVRRDQGGDTVSEGQAYALLLAVGVRDRSRFASVWRWTREHLRRPDGLLAWHWADGRVVDREPAADADLDTARALLLAADRFGRPRYRAEAIEIGDAVLAHETAVVHATRVLVAGPWARGARTINPSYDEPATFAALFEATRSGRWWRIGRDSRYLVRNVLSLSPFLPPDWLRMDASGRIAPAAPPSRRGSPAVYGLDAERLPVRLAESCETSDRRLAASMWPVLHGAGARLARGYSMRGAPRPGAATPLGLVAAAAAASAAGDEAQRAALLDRAARRNAAHPTYYDSAWVALGRLMLTTRRLGGCAV